MGFEGLEQKVTSKVEDILIDEDALFLVDVLVKGHVGNQKLIVEIDGEEGLPIDKCAEVSRVLGAWIEEEEIIDSKYILEVSSPGADKPLKLQRQYPKHIGRKLKVEKVDRNVLEGELLAVNEESLQLAVTDKKKRVEYDIPFKEINSSNVIISFK